MEDIQNTIDHIIEFLTPNIACVNTHTVHFMVEKLWESTIPKPILDQVNTCDDFNKLLEEFWQSRQTNFKSENGSETSSELVKFFQASEKYRLTSLMNAESVISMKELNEKLQARRKVHVVESAKVSQLMSEKKSYEVKVMSQVVAAVTNSCDSSHIIDLGKFFFVLLSMKK